LGARRVEEGRSDVAAARRCFDEIGARPWSARATAALADSPSPASSPSLRLSQAERRVALAIGEGVTNKEAAERLYLSVKTVDYHLGNIYRKLGVRNRTHLARLLSEETDAGVAASIS
jgi:DNA-binding NarL/FixJ family response regulator